MQATLKLQRTLTALLITGILIFVLAPAHAADAPKVTANNYVRALLSGTSVHHRRSAAHSARTSWHAGNADTMMVGSRSTITTLIPST